VSQLSVRKRISSAMRDRLVKLTTILTATILSLGILPLFTGGITPASATPTTTTNPPQAPVQLTPVVDNSTSVTLNWSSSASSTVTGYNVYEGTSTNGESATAVNTTPLSQATTSYQVTGLTAKQSYYFTIKAVDSSSNTSAASNEVTATPNATPILYVAQSGTDSSTCGTHSNTCKTIGQAVSNASSGDTINVGSSTATSPFQETVIVNKDLTITGQGASSTFVGGTSTSNMVSGSVFTVSSGITATITAMTIQYGNTAGLGGGIFNSGTLTATNDTISNNTAIYGGGGGINNSGTLTATNDTISGNTAGNGAGGGIFNNSNLTATNDTISGNKATNGDGGGIFNNSNLTATNDTISNNTAIYGGGGGINNSGTLTATNDTISGNTAGNGAGGGIFNNSNLTATNDTISGNKATNGDGGGIFNNSNLTATLTATNDTISGNSSGDFGGGIYNSGTLTATNDTISGNTAISGNGGGIYNSGTLTATNDTISGNAAPNGGGIFNISGTLTATNDTISGNKATNGDGGGIFNNSNLTATLTATNDTISGNTATSGGGIFNSSNLTATNDTISGNTAGQGAGIFNNRGTLTATNDTISGNTAIYGNGGGIYNGGGTLTLAASIIADQNSGGNCTVNGGTITDAGYNLDSDGTCGLTSSKHSLSSTTITLPTLITVGSTQVIPIAPLSPAFDVIPSTSLLCTGGNSVVLVTGQPGINIPSTDQVGNPRIVTDGTTSASYCSIGSYQDQTLALFQPQNLTAIPTGNKIDLSWSPSTNALGKSPDSYSVYVGSTSGNELKFAIKCADSRTTSCTFTPSTLGATYYFYVVANSATYGNSVPSSEVSTIANNYPSQPLIPNATANGTSSITISWEAPSSDGGTAITSYQVFEGTAPAKESTSPVCTTTTTTTCTVTGLNPSATYYFDVVAKNGTGNSKASNEVSTTTATPIQSPSVLANPGYYIAANDGGVFTYGSANFYGSLANTHLNKPIVGITSTPDGKGYWLVASDGGVFSFGGATFYGSTGNMTLNKPIVGITSTPDGKGYWLVASDGGVFSFGDATFYGSTGNMTLNKPIVGITATPDGKGYWLVASDGGVFSFGDAIFYGSTGNMTLNKPIVGITSTPDGKGYWLVASDGGVFSFGDAIFYGSTGNMTLNKPIVGITSTPDGKGYWLVASDGGVFSFGDATFLGSVANLNLNQPADSIRSVALAG
ncbi:unnamed protein product, partial [Acidithrix sp. C25]